MITNIVILVQDLTKTLLVLCGCLNYKLKRKFIGAWVVLGMSVVVLVAIGVWNNRYRTSMFYFIVPLIAVMMIEGKRKGLFASVVFLGFSCIDTIALLVLAGINGVSGEVIHDNHLMCGLCNTISLVGILIATILLQKMYYGRGKKGIEEIHTKGRAYLWLFFCGMTAFSITVLPMDNNDFVWNKVNVILFVIPSFVFMVLFLIMGGLLVYNNSEKQHYKEVARVNQDLVEAQEKYYQMLLEKEEETRRFRHDMSSHLVCVKRLLEENKVREAEDYLETMGGTLRELAIKHQTGNSLVNAIVNDVSGRYAEVELDWKGHLPKKIQMSDIDVCVIFSNLLENAFWAAASETAGTVEVTVKSEGGALAITVENDMTYLIEEREGKLITQKADKKNHGYGMRNVRECVEKNDGTVEYKYTDKRFTVDMVLVNVT